MMNYAETQTALAKMDKRMQSVEYQMRFWFDNVYPTCEVNTFAGVKAGDIIVHRRTLYRVISETGGRNRVCRPMGFKSGVFTVDAALGICPVSRSIARYLLSLQREYRNLKSRWYRITARS